MALLSTFAPVDYAIAILILELDIARTIYQALTTYGTLKQSLISHSVCIYAVACVIRSEIIIGEIALGLKAPDSTIFLTRIVFTQKTIGIPLGDYSLIVVEVEGCIYGPIIKAIAPIDGKFPTTCTHRTCILPSCRLTYNRRQFLSRSKHVLILTLEPIEGHVEAILKETEVDTDIGSSNRLPSERRRNE